jgi:hypothetical protein
MLASMALSDDIARIGAVAARHAAADEQVAAVLAAEPTPGRRVFLCAFTGADGRSWLALTADGTPVRERSRVREAVSLAALCEIAEETSGIEDRPHVASPEYLDELGRVEGVAAAVQQGFGAVDELAREVEARYKVPLVGS